MIKWRIFILKIMLVLVLVSSKLFGEEEDFSPRLFLFWLCMACLGHADHYFPQAEHLVVQPGLDLVQGPSSNSSPCFPTCSSTSSGSPMSLCLASACFSCRHTLICLKCHRYGMDFMIRFYIRLVWHLRDTIFTVWCWLISVNGAIFILILGIKNLFLCLCNYKSGYCMSVGHISLQNSKI